jgi:WD40 repeat protein
MYLGKRWNLPAVGCIALTTLIALLLRPGCTGRRPGEAEEQQGKVLEAHRWPVQALAFAPGGAAVTSAAYFPLATETEVEVAVWDAATGTRTAMHAVPLRALRCGALAPGGRTLAAGGEDGGVWLWDAEAPREPRLLTERRSPVCALAFSGDGRLLAIADQANDVTVWDVAGGRSVACCKGHVTHVLAFAPDGRALASSGGTDTTVRLWHTTTGEERRALRGHTRPVPALAYAPDVRTLASADWDGAVKLWDVATGTERAALATSGQQVAAEKFFEEVTAVAFSPDSRVLAVAVERDVQLWDVDRGVLLATLSGHAGKVKCLAYSADGTLLASGAHDRTVRLWEVARYRPMRP